MKLLFRLPFLFAFLALAFLAHAQESVESTSQSITEQLDALLAAHHDIDQLSGTVLVADGGKIVYQGSVGMANSDWGIPNGVDTKFRLASVSKQFTAMLVMQLVRDGKIDLEAPITKYLPDYPAESGDRVTIHHLLNHTSGIPSYTNRPGFMRNESKRHYNIDEFVVEFCSDPLEFDPGTKFSYNNSGYFLLGAIVEAVTHTTYPKALRKRIFDPLEMNDTGYDDQYAVLSNRATGYNDILGGRRVAMWLDMSSPYAAGGLYSTVGDMWKWDQALRAKKLLDGELEQLMFTAGLSDYAFGWEVATNEETGNKSLSHSGGMPGVSTLIWRMPELGRCVIVLGNSYNSNTRAVRRDITEILDGRQPKAPAPRGDYVVARRVLEKGIEAGLEELDKWPQIVRDEYIERDVNAIGYSLIEQGRYDQAIQLFEFLTVTYPTSSNTWDSLGEGHALAGHVELAIENYKKALELDPENELIPAVLEKLRAQS